ncbi:unnamed protein product [Ranitomeya imitator]|uniref:Sm domain-containing protein n=1 Tax=Ranitomeya imitator TaxID=111125 RepID=A0ABN9MS31_9NEOB|nr:unnamed protein product [Ranitomeya imitator]
MFLTLVTDEIKKIKPRFGISEPNLEKHEWEALSSLEKDHKIVVKPSDKGGNVVFLDRSQYLIMCINILSDLTTYETLKKDPTLPYQAELKILLTGALEDGLLSKSEFDFMFPKYPTLATLYALPKTHKGYVPLKGRPIVAVIETVPQSVRLGDWDRKILQRETRLFFASPRRVGGDSGARGTSELTGRERRIPEKKIRMSLRKQTPSDFLKQIIGRPVVVKLNSGVDYRGVLACLDGYMNIALEQTEEYVNGQLKNKYGDAFIRGNNEGNPQRRTLWLRRGRPAWATACIDSAERQGVPEQAKRTGKSKHKQCAICTEPLPDSYTKSLCQACIDNTLRQEESVKMNEIRLIIREELQSLGGGSSSINTEKKKRRVSSPRADTSAESGEVDSEVSQLSDSSGEEDFVCFPTEGINNLVKSVRNTMGVSESKEPQTPQEIMFAGLSQRKGHVFPINQAIKDLVKKEWG